MSSAITPHACSKGGSASLGHYRCEGAECGGGDNRFNGVCDANGCDFQTFRLGDKGFYGPGANFTVDSSKKVSVVTQFITADGTDSGKLTEIRRSFVQDGKKIPLPSLSVGGSSAKFDSVTEAYCQAEVDWTKDGTNFLQKGGLASIDAALEAGMVLVMSVWDDASARMQWLDGVQGTGPGSLRGTCPPAGGDPATIRKQHPNSPISFSNIKWGDIGSTQPGTPAPGPQPTPVPTPPPPYAGPCKLQKGYNCYGGHGATEIGSEEGGLSVAACAEKCAGFDGCTGFVVTTEKGDAHTCFLRKDIDLTSCSTKSQWDTYTCPSGPAPPAPKPPSPSGCPGGSLSACMDQCPSSPATAYKACVQDCEARC